MVKLIAKTAFGNQLPVSVGRCTLGALLPAAITSIAPQSGQERAVSEALKNSYGLAFPAPNRATVKAGTRCVWFGPGLAMLMGPVPKPINGASLTDQTDGWAVMQLQGDACVDVLASLVPVDLRPAVFKRGHTARTTLFHMPLSVTRTGASSFDLMVFRSMASTAVDEILTAMATSAAKAALSDNPEF